MFEQPEMSGSEPLRRRTRSLIAATMLFIVTSARILQTRGWSWSLLAAPFCLLLVFGPVMLGQWLGRSKK